MAEYVITIEETVVQEFKIVAESSEEALIQAERKYKNGEIMLDSGEVQHKQMRATRPDCEISEWYEF